MVMFCEYFPIKQCFDFFVFSHILKPLLQAGATLRQLDTPAPRFLARISKMPVQISDFKISAHPDLATTLLQILIPATFNSLVCHKGKFTLQVCPRRLVRKIFGYYPPKVKLKNLHRNVCLSKQEVFS